MKHFPLVHAGLVCLLTAVSSAADDMGAVDARKLPPAAAGVIDFRRDIKPILAKTCLECHGPTKQRGGLRLDDGAEAMLGGNSGAVIKAGDAAGSKLLQVVAGLDPDLKMPPKSDALTAAQIGLLRAWIEQGANWPKETAVVATGAKASHWAFILPQRPPLPTLAAAAGVRNEIDAFVRARLEAEGITPSPEADRVTLIRRLSLDLSGLPPTPREVDQFLQDPRADAYEQLVERLLNSPHYGERWGRHWLDLARYADSDGYEKDSGRPHAWRFRTWVIDALNQDLPFDQFTIEQLAGDLLTPPTPPSKVGEENGSPPLEGVGVVDRLIATGFHRNTLTNREGGVDKEQFRVEAVLDRVSTTAKVWLGLTLGCAQCHDHKYDPFSQREFYQFFAFFNGDDEVDITAPLPEEVGPYKQKKAAHDKKKAELDAAVAAYRKTELRGAQEKWESELKLAELRELPENIRSILLVDPPQRTDKQKKELAGQYAKIDKKLIALTRAQAAHQRAAPVLSQAQTLAVGTPRKTHVLLRGDFLRPGAEVRPGTPFILPPLQATGTATRLDLAKWLVDPANPLTARVSVNWMWQKYFGRGMVATLDDFGTQGEKPTHPALLDWLATEFSRQKWSLKALHKLMVTSATYRQSSHLRPELLARDPLNLLLARQSRPRLEAEIVRDNALAASGLLVPKVGGPSVRPPQPAGVSELTYAGSAKWVETTGPDRYRRGLYTWFQRTSPFPMLMTFDSPDSNLSCVRRERSNTPLQALTLLNDTTFVECAQALGMRVLADKPKASTPARLRYAFRLCLARAPTESELETLGHLFDGLLQNARSRPAEAVKLAGTAKPANVDRVEWAAWVALARTILNLDEFVTRE